MPLFEYECKKCNEKHELLVGSAKKKPKCPHCGGKRTRLFSPFGVKSGASFTSSSGGGSCPPSCTKSSCSTCK